MSRYVQRFIIKLISKALWMARVKGITVLPATHRFIPTNGSYPAFTPSRSASPHFGRYSFAVSLRIGG